MGQEEKQQHHTELVFSHKVTEVSGGGGGRRGGAVYWRYQGSHVGGHPENSYSQQTIDYFDVRNVAFKVCPEDNLANVFPLGEDLQLRAYSTLQVRFPPSLLTGSQG